MDEIPNFQRNYRSLSQLLLIIYYISTDNKYQLYILDSVPRDEYIDFTMMMCFLFIYILCLCTK